MYNTIPSYSLFIQQIEAEKNIKIKPAKSKIVIKMVISASVHLKNSKAIQVEELHFESDWCVKRTRRKRPPFITAQCK